MHLKCWCLNCFQLVMLIHLGRKFTCSKNSTGAKLNKGIYTVRGHRHRGWTDVSYSAFCVLMKTEVCRFHLIIFKLLWQSSWNGSCSFLYQLSDLYLASLQKQSLPSQLVWSGRFWIRSVPLKGLMFPVLSHGFTHSHKGKGESCWAALEPC